MSYQIINLSFIVIFIFGALYFWLRTAKIKTKNVAPASIVPDQAASGSSLISIAVPRNNDRTPQAAEQMFAAFHGIFRAGSAIQPHLSFEIATRGQTILFYVYMPNELKDFVLSQIYAQYPNVEITNIPVSDDYAVLPANRHLAATELTLKRPSPYPIKSFVNFEVDPLSGITGVLSAAGENEDMWVQMLVRPVADDWQDQGDTEIKNIKKPPKHKSWAELIAEKSALFVIDFFKSVATGAVGEAEKKKDDKGDKKEELTGSQQQAVKGIEEKITKLGFETTIRLVATHNDATFAQARLEQLIGAFKQYNSINLNSFISKEISNDPAAIDLYRARAIGTPEIIFNITELASLYHFPSETVATPSITWAGSRKGEPPANLPLEGTVAADELTVFAETNFRARIQKFGVKRKDRRLHMYIIGKTGTGKSTLMENMIFDDIREGRGVAVVDPHGELIDHVLNLIPENRIDDVVYFSPADHDHPIGFNILEYVDPQMRNVVASGVVGIFKKIFGESWGPRLEYILRNAILALLETPNSTLLGVMRILSDNAYRRQVISQISDPVVKDFFINEFEKYEPKFRQEAIAPIQNKVGQFTSSSTIRNIIGQPKSGIDIRQIMDTGKILLADLSTGKIGEDNSALLGAMLITKIQLAAMGRTNVAEDDRRDFYLYVDEFQNFATDSFATILSEARKYRLNLVMINQYINQMPETVANAVFGNVGTMIAFRVGAGDAEAMKNEFAPVFEVNDLVNLPNRQIYLKMAIDGVTVPAFSASTLPPPAEKYNLSAQVIDRSRQHFSTPRGDVEDYVAEWSAPINLSQEGESRQKSMAQDFEKIVTKPAEKIGESEQKIDQPKSEMGESEAKIVGESAQPNVHALPKNTKIEMLTDRFNRHWYAVTDNNSSEIKGAGEQLEKVTSVPDYHNNPFNSEFLTDQPIQTESKTDTTVQSGGVVERKDEAPQLITWEKADELGLKLPNQPNQAEPINNEFQPIDEL